MSTNKKPYLVVLMLEKITDTSAGTTIVPAHWIRDKNVTFYPPGISKQKIDGLVKAGPYGKEVEQATWRLFPYVLLKRCATWEEANAFLMDKNNYIESESDDKNLKILKQVMTDLKQGQSKKNIKQDVLSAANISQLMKKQSEQPANPTPIPINISDLAKPSSSTGIGHAPPNVNIVSASSSAAKDETDEIIDNFLPNQPCEEYNLSELSFINVDGILPNKGVEDRLTELTNEVREMKKSLEKTVSSVLKRELSKFLATMPTANRHLSKLGGSSAILLPILPQANEAVQEAAEGTVNADGNDEEAFDVQTVSATITTVEEFKDLEKNIAADHRGDLVRHYVRLSFI